MIKKIPPLCETSLGKILVGGKNVFLLDTPLYMANKLDDILKYISSQKCVNVFVGCDLCYEDTLKIGDKKNIIFITTDFSCNQQNHYDCIEDAFSLVKNLALSGQNVNMILYNVGGIMTNLDKIFASQEKIGGHALDTDKIIKAFMGLPYASDTNSVTLYAICDKLDKEDVLIKHDVIKICNVLEN